MMVGGIPIVSLSRARQMVFPELTPVYQAYRYNAGGRIETEWRLCVGYIGRINGEPTLLYKNCPTDGGYHTRTFNAADWHPTPESAILAAAAKCSERYTAELATLYKVTVNTTEVK